LIKEEISHKYIPDRFFRLIGGCIDIILIVFIYKSIFSINENISIHTVVIGYLVLIPVITNGQTFGQLLFGYKLISLIDKKLTLLQIMSRQVLSIYLSTIFFLGEMIGNFPFLSDTDQLPQDRLLQTVVIKKRYTNEFLEENKLQKKQKYYNIGFFLGITNLFLFCYVVFGHYLPFY